mmetsp:Transcript_15215/g.53432  ORF Transcript_15215/g.53432 Transcript_15215/m.53432 type:complete len:509 (+) Transcript_15215:339-1865(+)
MRALKQLRLPAQHEPHGDTLWHVLAAQNGGCRGDSLRSVHEYQLVHGGELDEIVRQAEALLRPARPPQVSAQKGVGSGLVQLEAERLSDRIRLAAHLLLSVGPISQRSQATCQLFVLERSAGLQLGGHDGASDADELVLRVLQGVLGEVGVDVAEGAEQHALGVQSSIQRPWSVDAGVHLGDPVEENLAQLAMVCRIHKAGAWLQQETWLKEYLALGGLEDGSLAIVGEGVAPQVQLLENDVGGEGLGQAPRASVREAVVAQRQAPQAEGRRGQDHGEGADADVGDAVRAEAELAQGRVVRRFRGQGHGPDADVAEAAAAQLLLQPAWRCKTPLEGPCLHASRAKRRAASEGGHQVHDALQELGEQVAQVELGRDEDRPGRSLGTAHGSAKRGHRHPPSASRARRLRLESADSLGDRKKQRHELMLQFPARRRRRWRGIGGAAALASEDGLRGAAQRVETLERTAPPGPGRRVHLRRAGGPLPRGGRRRAHRLRKAARLRRAGGRGAH